MPASPCPQFARRHHPDFDKMATQGWKALEAEASSRQRAWRKERQWALDMGLPGADSLTDRNIPTFARGELPHFAGINTFMKAPYVENVRDVGKYDAAVIGIPFDSGTTYRPGTRFGPQGIRRISALYTPYNYELGVDLREQMTLCDAGDVFTIPANLEKSFDQIIRGVAHVFSSGALPVMLGGDHSIGFPCVRGIAQCTDKRIGIIHFDRHIDIQEKDLDERMHTTPWFWATNLPNVPAVNLVQLGIGGWQVPREGVQVARKRNTNVLTIADIEELGIEKTAEIALELAWKDADAVYISFDVDSIDCGFVPGTGWPEPGGFLPREALKLLGLVARKGFAGSRSSRSRRPMTPPTSPRCSAFASSSTRSARWRPMASSAATDDHQQTRHLLRPAMDGDEHGHSHDDHDHGHASRSWSSHAHAHEHPSRPWRPRTQSRARAPVAQWQTPHSPGTAPGTGGARSRQGRGRLHRRLHRRARSGQLPAPVRIPFEITAADGAKLNLLRVEIDALADVGSLTPHLGGGSFRYDPLPASMVSHRRRLRFVYFDGDKLRPLTFTEVRAP